MEKEFRQKPIESDPLAMPDNFTAALEVIASYAPPFAFLISLGFGVIYAITVNGFPNIEPPIELLWLAISAAIAGLVYLTVPWLIKKRIIVLAETIILFSYELFLLAFAFLWNVSQTYLYVLVWVLPIFILWLCDSNKRRIMPLIAGVVGSLGVFILTRIPGLVQRPVDTFISTISTFYLVFVIVAWIGLIIVVRIIQFRRLTARLTSSFFFLVMIPTVITALIAAFQSYARDTNNIYLLLDATTMVKEQQINQIITGMFQDMGFMLRDPVAKQRFEFVFTSEPNAAISKINKSIVLSYLDNVIEQSNNEYEEALLLDIGGNVVLSNMPESIGRNYENKTFFRQGLLESILNHGN